jgi:sulfofructose kinase
VVVTLGSAGVAWSGPAGRGRLPAFEVTVVDTTGAGDAFHGAFAAGLAEGMDWEPLIRYASAAGALCCTKPGARPGLPFRDELRRFLEERP